MRYHSANGIVLSGDVMKLGQCFHDYVASEGDNIHRTIQKNVESIQVVKISKFVRKLHKSWLFFIRQDLNTSALSLLNFLCMTFPQERR